MTSPAFEVFLAKIYVNAEYRSQFLADPRGTAQQAGLSEAECEALNSIDRTGLEMAARSLARKRKSKQS